MIFQSDARSVAVGKKARISLSPATKSLNPYQALSDAGTDEDDVNESNETIEIDSDDEPVQLPAANDAASLAPSEDLNISYGTIEPDAVSFDDDLDDSSLQQTVTRCHAEGSKGAVGMAQQIAETQENLRKLRVQPTNTAVPFKPDAGEGADTGSKK